MRMAVCLLVLTMGCACAVAHAGQGDVHLGTFDESEGTLADDVTGNQPGVVHAAQWVQGQIGSGLKPDGIDDYVALPDNDPLWLPTGDFTIAFWVCFERDRWARRRLFARVWALPG